MQQNNYNQMQAAPQYMPPQNMRGMMGSNQMGPNMGMGMGMGMPQQMMGNPYGQMGQPHHMMNDGSQHPPHHQYNNMRGGGRGRGGHHGSRGDPHARNNDIGEASTVIHLRNVTPEVSQLSIQNTIQSFGRIRNIVMLRQKNQALVEMESVNAAQQLVEFFKDPGYVEIDGRRVYVRYSLHTELTATQHTSKTLLVSMFNTQYDVSAAAQITATIVYQIFGNYGQVERIVVLPKNDSSAQNHNRVQALVQFDSKETAMNVKNILQGQPVTLGETITFTLDIQFSRMDEIKTSSPHNSLVIPKPGAVPQPPQPQQGFNPQQQQQPQQQDANAVPQQQQQQQPQNGQWQQ